MLLPVVLTSQSSVPAQILGKKVSAIWQLTDNIFISFKQVFDLFFLKYLCGLINLLSTVPQKKNLPIVPAEICHK